MGTDIMQSGFGNGFSKEVEAILEVADRGLLYAQEVRENLQKAGMIIYEKIDLPEVDIPQMEEDFVYEDEDGNDDTEEAPE
jgi:predicted ATP-dependent Lon-type protease